MGRGELAEQACEETLRDGSIVKMSAKGFMSSHVEGFSPLHIADVRTTPAEVVERIWSDLRSLKGEALTVAIRMRSPKALYWASRAIGA